MKNRAVVWGMCGIVCVALAGCNDDNARDLKREQDRLAIDLARVTKERDQYRSRLGQMQSNSTDTDKKLQERVDELEQRVSMRDDEIKELQRRLTLAEHTGDLKPTTRRATEH